MQDYTRINGALFAFLLFTGLWPIPASAETEGQLVVIAAPSGSIYGVGAEFGGTGSSSFVARAGGFSYSIKDGSYWEDGSGSFIGISGRFYATKPMEGMFFGAGIDLLSGNWNSGDYWSASWHYDNGTISGVAPNAIVGYKVRNGDWSIEPSLSIVMLGSAKTTVAAGIGLVVGKRF